MHDYLKLTQGPLVPPNGDFATYVLKLQQHKLVALDPSTFADPDAQISASSILQQIKAQQEQQRKPRNTSAPTAQQRSPAPKAKKAVRTIKPTEVNPSPVKSHKTASKGPHNALGLLIFFMFVFSAGIINFFAPTRQIAAGGMFGLVFTLIICLIMINKRRKR